MHDPYSAPERRSMIGNIVHWFRDWSNRSARFSELESCGKEEAARIAQDVGVSLSELCTLASKSPNAADLLYLRMEALHIDKDEIARSEPGLLRDLQRLCTTCGHHKRCARDLAEGATNSAWRAYCPNAWTLHRLFRKPMGYLGLPFSEK